MSVVAKVFIKRISDDVDEVTERQDGLREGKGQIEQIFVLMNIVEQEIEWNSSLFLCPLRRL